MAGAGGCPALRCEARSGPCSSLTRKLCPSHTLRASNFAPSFGVRTRSDPKFLICPTKSRLDWHLQSFFCYPPVLNVGAQMKNLIFVFALFQITTAQAMPRAVTTGCVVRFANPVDVVGFDSELSDGAHACFEAIRTQSVLNEAVMRMVFGIAQIEPLPSRFVFATTAARGGQGLAIFRPSESDRARTCSFVFNKEAYARRSSILESRIRTLIEGAVASGTAVYQLLLDDPQIVRIIDEIAEVECGPLTS